MFDEALTQSDPSGADEVARLQLAADLYAGDLLDGWYDEWLIPERDRAGVSLPGQISV